MNRAIRTLGLTLLFGLILSPVWVQAQGCSDAGFCSMGALRSDQKFSRRINFKLRSVEVGQYVGMTRFKDYILATTAEATFGFNAYNYVHVKLPYQTTLGQLANVSGLSDVSLSYTRTLRAEETWQINGSVGMKIPTHQPNIRTEDGRSLPMYYQPTLGTYDIILGLSYINQDWLFATGVQHALTRTPSDFLWADWEGHPMEQMALMYPQGNQLKRGTDVMFRVERNLRLGNKNFYTGLLPIYRINNDVITLPDGTLKEMLGSKGLAMTWLNGAGYQFSVRSGVKAMAGIRVVERDQNPDGLSRKFVLSFGYEYRF